MTIRDLRNSAELSLASYATLRAGMPEADYIAALQDAAGASMALAEAVEFAAAYSVEGQWSDRDTGFSASLFKRKSDAALYFAIRGTQINDFSDLKEDAIWILSNGYARNQTLSLYNTLSTLLTLQGNQARQKTVVDLLASPVGAIPKQPFGSYRVVDALPVIGQGLLANTSGITLVGHSLGGHLAIAAARLFPGLASNVHTYNAPGFDLAAREARINAYFAALGGSSAIPWEGMTHVRGVGPSAAATLHELLGTPVDVFIENSVFAPNDHRQRYNTDSLAMYDLFARIDAQADPTAITDVLKSASNSSGDSLEATLDALMRLFVRATEKTPDDRELYWTRLNELRPVLDATEGALGASSLAQTVASELMMRAQSDLAYRYALKELNPFAVLGVDSLYAAHNPRSAPGVADGPLDLYESATHLGSLTSQWIADRAAFLRWKNLANIADVSSQIDAGSTENWRYVDLPQNYSVTVFGTATGAAPSPQIRRAVFGGDRSDALSGSFLADRLYGGAGADVLTGGRGDDYLEGGSGVDVYRYNSTSSGLANDGVDEIRDVDGKGVIRYAFTQAGVFSSTVRSTIIGGVGIKTTADEWLSPDGKFTYSRQFDGALRVTINGDAGGSIRILDFDYAKAAKDGYLGLRLIEPRATPAGLPEIFGDQGDEGSADVLYGNRPDTEVPPTTPGEKINAGLDNDIVFADRRDGETLPSGFGNADWVIGAEGRDQIEAGAGNDLVEGGSDGVAEGDAGGDIVDGGAGDDELYAEGKVALASALSDTQAGTGLKGEFLAGGEGDDWVAGARGNDVLTGGRGADLIVGGAGDDNLFGDSARAAGSLFWTATREVTVQGSTQLHRVIFNEVSNPAEGLGEADVLYGGEGADWLFAGAGDDFADGGTQDDVVFGGEGADILIGGEGNDALVGDRGENAAASESGDVLDGGAGEDSLEGNGGDDVLIGGAGRDILQGGAGKDIYVFERGDAAEEEFIFDIPGTTASPEASVVVLGDGIRKADVKFRPGSLLLDVANGDDPAAVHDRIHIEGFDPNDPLANPVLDSIHFADGEVMTYADVLAQGFDIDGTDAAEVITGTAVTDRIDTRKGSDLAIGGEGADTYTVNLGDGQDTLEEASGGNVVRFGAGIASGDLQVTPWTGFDGRGAFGQYLRVTYKVYPGGGGRFDPPPPPPDELFLSGGLQGNFARYEFADGSSLTHAELMQRSIGSVSVMGTDADESMVGSNFGDTLVGAGGHDTLLGQGGNDQLYGGEGDDALEGQDGNDSLSGGAGEDILDGGAGSDQLSGDEGFDALSGGEGSDQLFGGEDDDVLDGGADGDVLHGDAGADSLAGGEGDDVLFGGADADELDGGAGADVLNGDEGDDRLAAGAGDDLLQGGAGSDTYTLNAGDGADVIRDAEGANRVVFGAGIAAADLALEQYIADDGTDFLSIGYSGGTLDIADGVLGSVAEFEFADGSVVELPQLLAGAPALVARGTEAAETLYGSNNADELLGAGGEDALNGQGGDDFLSGGTGADVLLGGAGDDTLSGNAGDDLLAGGAGADTYRIGFAAGHDTIAELAGESSVLELEPGLFPADLSAERGGDDLVLRRRGTEEGVTIEDYYVQPHAWTLKDAQGATQDLADFLAGAPGNTTSHTERLRALAIGQFTRLFAERGYALRADGRQHLETTESIPGRTTAVHRAADYAIAPRSDEVSENLAAGGSWSSTLVSRTETQTEIVVRNASPEFRYAAGSVNSDPQTTPNFYPSGIGYSGFAVPLGATLVQVSSPQGGLSGNWVYPEGTAPAGAAPAVGDPGVTTIVHTTVREEYDEHLQLDELAAGDGANTIAVSGNAIVDAGGGDDLILGAYDNAYWSSSRSDYPGIWGDQQAPGWEFLFGGNGADTIYGGQWADVLAGGEGHDRLYGQGGADVYYVDAGDAGIDYVEDEGGIAQTYGGAVEGSLSEIGLFQSWYYERIGYVDDGTAPRPALPYANDFAAWEPAYGTPLINPDVVRFGPGIRLQDLSFAWSETQFLGFPHAVLNIRWAADKGIDVHLPRADDTIGSGIEVFEFDDGTRLTMREMIARAPAHDYQYLDVLLGDGDDVFAGRSADETVRGGDGNDTLLGVGDMDALYEYWSHYTRPNVSGDDLLYGEGGDDLLGGLGLLDGGAGADELIGGGGFAAGGSGNDSVVLSAANGAVYAFNRGDGADFLSVGNVTTISLGAIAPSDIQISSIGDEILLGLGAGDSIRLAGAPENFRLQFFGPEVRLQDLAGTELLVSSTSAVGGQLAYDYATFGSNAFMTSAETRAVLSGGMLAASAFARRVAGTPGDDLLSGGAGDDVFHPNGGVDTIGDEGGIDAVVFGEGVSADDLSLGLGSLLIRAGDAEIHLENFDPQDPFGAHDIERFRFADGTELSYAQLISRGFDLTGTDAAETITGTSTADRIDGRGGDDLLAGGYGSDTYFFEAGSGNDRIVEAFSLADSDVLRIGAAPRAVEVARSGDDLVLALTQSGEQVAVRWFSDPAARIESVRFADGTAWDATTFEAQAVSVNTPPVLTGTLADQAGREGEALGFAVPAGTFTDVDGDTLTLSARLADGSALPAWLAFDAASGGFSGTPGSSDAGTYAIEVSATDSAGASASGAFGLSIEDGEEGEILIGTPGRDVLTGTPFDDLLAGGRGNDRLSGGAGNDLYLHERHGGHDVIDEAGLAHEGDVLRFGEGITRGMVKVERHGRDLLLDLDGPHGSVRIKDWFASSAQRVERIEFADGTSWNEAQIRRRAGEGDGDGDDGGPHHDHGCRDDDDRHGRRGDHDRDDHRHDHRGARERDRVADSIAARLAQVQRFDFESLLRAPPRHGEPVRDVDEIARQWRAVAACASALADEGDGDPAMWGHRPASLSLGAGWGFDGSVGAARGADGLKTLEGLLEGFRRL